MYFFFISLPINNLSYHFQSCHFSLHFESRTRRKESTGTRTLYAVIIAAGQRYSTKSAFRFCIASHPAPGVAEVSDGKKLWQHFWLEIRLNTLSLVNHFKEAIHHQQITTYNF